MKTHGHSPEINSPTHWRMRAEEIRKITEETHDPEVGAMMLRIAASYDRLAEHAEAGPSQVSFPETAPATFGGSAVDP